MYICLFLSLKLSDVQIVKKNMSTSVSKFPVSSDDLLQSMASTILPNTRGSSEQREFFHRKPPKPNSHPSTQPASARNTPPPLKINYEIACPVHTASNDSSKQGSTRASLTNLEVDGGRRTSVSRLASGAVKDLRKGVKNVTDTTKKATSKVKDKTVDMGVQMKDVTKDARKWMTVATSKTAKAAMEQARSGLSVGEKFTLFASEKITVLSRKGFTHIFMFLILIGYTALGALLFMMCESPHEKAHKLGIVEHRRNLTEALWNSKSENLDDFYEEVKELLVPYNTQLYKAFSSGVTSDPDTRVWTFLKAMFYCCTITTTIGYGHITPQTNTGKALTIIYAIIGIPIFLILMADFGKLFTRLLKYLFIFITRVYSSGTCIRAREHPTIQKYRKAFAVKSLESRRSNFVCSNQANDHGCFQTNNYPYLLTNSSPILAESTRIKLSTIDNIKYQDISTQETTLYPYSDDDDDDGVFEHSPEGHEQCPVLNVDQFQVHFSNIDNDDSVDTLEVLQLEESRVKESNENEVYCDEIFDNICQNTSPNTPRNPTNENRNRSRKCFCFYFPKLTNFSRRASGSFGSLKSRLFKRNPQGGDVEDARTTQEPRTPTSQEGSGFVVGSMGSHGIEVDRYFVDDNFNLPVSLALTILLVYMIVGCIIYIRWEPWTFFEAFYFIFISMTTIGFGDYVPEHPAFMMATALYLVFGLALTAMCINIIQEKLSNTFREASRKLKESFTKTMESHDTSQTDGENSTPPPSSPSAVDVTDYDPKIHPVSSS